MTTDELKALAERVLRNPLVRSEVLAAPALAQGYLDAAKALQEARERVRALEGFVGRVPDALATGQGLWLQNTARALLAQGGKE